MGSLCIVDRRTLPPVRLASCCAVFDTCAQPWEHEQAHRLRRDDARMTYRLSHSILRLLLSRAMDVPPDGVDIRRAASGKPFAVDGPAFSLSHAGDLIAVALSAEDVGVDVEQVGAAGEPLTIALAPEDVALLPHLSADRHVAETVLWSIKEAALKLTGDVMRHPPELGVRRRGAALDVFEVYAGRLARAPFPQVFVRLVPVAHDYVVAVACGKAGRRFALRELQDEAFVAHGASQSFSNAFVPRFR